MTRDALDYNTHAVAKRTGVPAATFLAWERRHGVPRPRRDAQDKRRYSDADIADIEWMRDQTASGLRIADVARLLLERRHAPALPSQEDVVVSMAANRSLPDHALSPPDRDTIDATTATSLGDRILDAFAGLDSRRVHEALAELAATSSAVAALEHVLNQTLPTLSAQIETRIVPPVVRRFTENLIGQRIMAVIDAPPFAGTGTGKLAIVAGIGAGVSRFDVERASFGLVQRSGKILRLLMLGEDVPLPDLADAIDATNPDQVLLVATSAIAARTAGYFVQQEVRRRPGQSGDYVVIGPDGTPYDDPVLLEHPAGTSGRRRERGDADDESGQLRQAPG
jgi:DNA-binding transcriptional MerR regulator